MNVKRRIATALIFGATVLPLYAQESGVKKTVGPTAEGGFLLNNGWTIKPAGTMTAVDTLPMTTAVTRNGKFLLVMNAGFNQPSISVIDLATKTEVSRTKLADCFLGLTMSPKEDKVYVGGGTTGKIFEMKVDPDSGALTPAREFSGLKDLANKGDALIGDVAVTADGRILYAANLYGNEIAAVNLESGELIDTFATGKRPYRLLLPPGGGQLLVSSWAEGYVYQHDATNGKLLRKVAVGPHPTDMVWLNRPVANQDGEEGMYKARLFVAAGDSNSVFSLGWTRNGLLARVETIDVSLTPLQPLGMTPTALALNAQGTRLYVVCSDGNAVADIDVTGVRSQLLGFIPAGWYPTSVRTIDSGPLVILNGKGMGSKANPRGPNPTQTAVPLHQGPASPQVQFVGSLQTGTVQFVDMPDESQLRALTTTVRAGSLYQDDLILEQPPESERARIFQRTPNHASPIQHIIYVIKEGRSYDQVLGDMVQGNGDASLAVFGEKYTPNLHQLAKDYVLYDHFFANGDVDADGQNWASAAIAPDYTNRLWPSEYAQRSKVFDFESGELANRPPTGYLWGNAIQAGINIRDYGQWTTNVPLKSATSGIQIAGVKDPALAAFVDKGFRGPDLDYPDVERAKEFVREWKQFDSEGNAPLLSIVRLGNDHTLGTMPGKLSPFAYMADNDYAVGLLVDAVSHSRLWNSTAVFIVEGSAENGADHLDSHRVPAWVISPFTRRGTTDSEMYNQAGLLRSMEMILGLRPMTQFDAAAPTMFESFNTTADTTPFAAIEPKVSRSERNPAGR